MKTLSRYLLVLLLTVGAAACGTSITGPEHSPDPGLLHSPDPGM